MSRSSSVAVAVLMFVLPVHAFAAVHAGLKKRLAVMDMSTATTMMTAPTSGGGSTLRAQVGIDTRVYDSLTSEVVASTTSRGSASSHSADVKYSDAKVDASAAGFVTTPLGQASRQALDGAVQFIIDKLADAPWD